MKRAKPAPQPTRTDELNSIMKEQDLTEQAVATLLSVRLNTVQIWRCKNSTMIPAAKLELLKLKVAAKVA